MYKINNKIHYTFIVFIIVASCHIAFANNPNNSISSKNLYTHVKFLTATPQYRNHRNLESLNLVADYIDSIFSIYSDKVEIQPFLVNGLEYKNIICSFGPQNGERIIVGAHYDVCYSQPGADDNASGIAGLLELARVLYELTPKLKYRIDLVAFSLEEPPNFRTENMGSFIHAKSLYDSKTPVKVMICFDMIGYFDDNPNSQEYPVGILKPFYPDKANFIAVIGDFNNHFVGSKVKRLMRKYSDIKVCQLSGPSFIGGIDFSDHLNYWKYGYKAVLITDTAYYRNDRYHKISDTIETLNFKKMAEVVEGIYWVITQY